MRKFIFGLLVLALLPIAALAQVYPTQNPTYTPTPIVGPTLVPTGAGSSTVFQTNNANTMFVRVSGAPSGLVANMQVSEARAPTTIAATVTITDATPGVISWTNHNLSINQPVVFSTTGALPAGLVAGTTYYVIATGLTTGAFEVAATPGGAAINTTTAGSGTHTGTTTSVEWTNMSVDQVGVSRVASITGTGLYRLNVSGAAQVRFNVSALTSGVTYVSASAGNGDLFVQNVPFVRGTYSAASLIATGATTHFLSIAGSATKTVTVTHVECSGKATAAIAVNITAEVDSTADTVDAGTGVTAVPMDSLFPAATATVVSHTTSPTSGALVGLVRAGTLTIPLAAPTATDFPPNTILSWDFGGIRPGAQGVVLHGVAQSFSLNTSAAFGTGGVTGCALEWMEE